MCGRKTNLHGGVAGFLHEFYDLSLVFVVEGSGESIGRADCIFQC